MVIIPMEEQAINFSKFVPNVRDHAIKSQLSHGRVYVKAGLWTGLDSGLDHELQYGLNSGLIF